MQQTRLTFREFHRPHAWAPRRPSEALVLDRHLRAVVAPVNRRIADWQKQTAFLRAATARQGSPRTLEIAALVADVSQAALALKGDLDSIPGSRASSRASNTERALRTMLQALEAL